MFGIAVCVYSMIDVLHYFMFLYVLSIRHTPYWNNTIYIYWNNTIYAPH